MSFAAATLVLALRLELRETNGALSGRISLGTTHPGPDDALIRDGITPPRPVLLARSPR
jgi:hypothetical protein